MDNILSIDSDNDSNDSIDDNDERCEKINISGALSTSNKIIKEKLREQMPWIEKYRPFNIDDVIIDDNTLQKIKKIIEKKDMPNIIITGIPGIGKTTTLK